jgi:hypothetical protein
MPLSTSCVTSSPLRPMSDVSIGSPSTFLLVLPSTGDVDGQCSSHLMQAKNLFHIPITSPITAIKPPYYSHSRSNVGLIQTKIYLESNNHRVLTLPKGSRLKGHQRCKGCQLERKSSRGTRSDKCSGPSTPSPQVCLLRRNYLLRVLDDAVLLTSLPSSNRTPGVSADPTTSRMRVPRPEGLV